jgi:hypothetical protein
MLLSDRINYRTARQIVTIVQDHLDADYVDASQYPLFYWFDANGDGDLNDPGEMLVQESLAHVTLPSLRRLFCMSSQCIRKSGDWEDEMPQLVIQTLQDGPFLVKGPVELIDAEGKAIVIKAEPVGLCRCGQSTNKPFCDGCHRKGRYQLLPLL